MDIVYNILSFLAGLGVFLTAIKMISSSMQGLMGAKLKKSMQKVGSNKLLGSLFGILSTFGLQSSTATIVLVVGFVQVGAITFSQSLSIILGINIGSSLTFITLLLNSFKLGTFFAGLAGVGALVTTFAKKEKVKQVGQAITALGLIFFGMSVMSSSITFFKTYDSFNNLIASITHPALLMLIGLIIVLLSQSTLATNTIALALAGIGGGSAILTVQNLLWISLGARILPSISCFFIMVGARKSSQRVVVAYAFMSILSAFILLLFSITGFSVLLEKWLVEPTLVLIVYNLIGSTLASVVGLVLYKQFTLLMHKIIKKDSGDIYYMDSTMLAIPSMAVALVGHQVESLLEEFVEHLKLIKDYAFSNIDLAEEKLDMENKKLYIKISRVKENILRVQGNISDVEHKRMYFYNNLMGRYYLLNHKAENIIEFAKKYRNSKKGMFTDEQMIAVNQFYANIKKMSNITLSLIKEYGQSFVINYDLIEQMLEMNKENDKLHIDIKSSMIKNRKSAQAVKSADLYDRVINELEQLGEHFSGICISLEE